MNISFPSSTRSAGARILLLGPLRQAGCKLPCKSAEDRSKLCGALLQLSVASIHRASLLRLFFGSMRNSLDRDLLLCHISRHN
jgi:hypothetical protein